MKNGLVAEKIMQTEVTTVRADQPLLAVYRIFVDQNLNGAPVLDDDGDVVGVVSARDLLRAAEEEQAAAREDLHYYFGSDTLGEAEWRSDLEDFEDRLSKRTVSEVMTRGVISVSADASVPEIVDKILTHRIHRVLVIDDDTEGGSLIGIVSVFDLVELLR